MTKSRNRSISLVLVCSTILLVVLSAAEDVWAQGGGRRGRRGRGFTPPTPTLGLDQGLIELDTPDFDLKLVRASQTVAALAPKGAGGFDFTPADRLEYRTADGFYHLGDLTLRVRTGSTGDWERLSTAAARKPVTPLDVTGPDLAAADLAPTLLEDCPLVITRTWTIQDGKLVLRFDLTNKTEQPVEIGALGLPMIFNNHITGRSLEGAHETCSFFDPYIGADAGYLQVTRLSGHGPALVVVPHGKTPFEGYQVLREPSYQMPSRRGRMTRVGIGQTFEGSFEWMAHTKAYAEDEWSQVEPWNAPTARTLAPCETASYGVAFLVAPEIRQIEQTLAESGRPVAVGIPGYILPMDLNARLFLKSPDNVASISVAPEGAIEIDPNDPTPAGWQAFTLRGKKWGRARLTLTYEDGQQQAIHYYVIKPMAEAVADLGNFLMTKQWFVDPDDPFGRSPSVMSYDRERDQILAQEGRVWIAGLGDEGGSGSWLAAAMKQFGQPNRAELEKYEQFVNNVLWGGLQVDEGDRMFGVRKSLFFYEPEELPDGYYDPDINWGSWTSWDRRGSVEALNRSYNYPHVAAAYWAMYRLARNNEGLVTSQPWEWYLERAYQTGQAMVRFARGYTRHGQMEGDIFLEILRDLKREGWTEQADALERTMKRRADRWRDEAYPFGSEMAWDSTGQEEVYAWCKYFGYDDKALVSLNSILGYMPNVPHWGYDGCARRYWDFLYAAKLSRIERQLHHYGSGINAIPVLSHYREHPDDYYLLKIGYAGTMGALSNIDQEGFASVAFHSFPDTLKWDAYSGDYGPNFFGHALNAATYVINHPEFGWQAYGGNVAEENGTVKVKPLDSFRMRVYVAPLGLYLTLDAGQFEDIEIDPASGTVRVGLAAATRFTPAARLRIEQPAAELNVANYAPTGQFATEREAFVVPLQEATTWIELKPGS